MNQIKSIDKKKSKFEKIKKFHQFIVVEYGLVNAAIIDLLKGNIYQVEKKILEKFKNDQYDDIIEFIESAKKEEIIIDVNNNAWIPNSIMDDKNQIFLEQLNKNIISQLELEEGVDFDIIKKKFSSFKIIQLNYYGRKEGRKEIDFIANIDVINYREINFNRCLELSKIDGNLMKIQEIQYSKNKMYNSCWGGKIAVTKDGKVRPCIYSKIIIDDIYADVSIESLIDKLKKFWYLTKDKIHKCKDCELRYACFDCREIPMRVENSLYAANPYCKYNPYKGTWDD